MATIRIMIKNINFQLSFSKNRGEYLIFSLPQTNQYQKINKLKLSLTPAKIINEKKWGNKVAVFTLNDVEDAIKINFAAKLHPLDKNINPQLTIDNYKYGTTEQSTNYLKPDRFINGKDTQIFSLAKKTIGQEKKLLKIIRRLYDFVLQNLTYGKPTEGLYTYRQAMEERTTDCGGFSTFLASLLKSQNIPSRLVVGFLIKENIITKLFSRFEFCTLSFEFLLMHAWLEVMLPDGTWFPLDPSLEWRRRKGLTKRQGGFGLIPADRLVISYGQDFRFKIANKLCKIDILQKPIWI